MNNTLQLKGTFEQRKNENKQGSPNLPVGKTVNSEKLNNLLNDLKRII